MRCGLSLQSGLREQQRFRVVQKILPLYHAIQPAKAASRLGLPHALQDASRSRERRGFLLRDSVLECSSPLELSVGLRPCESAEGPHALQTLPRAFTLW